MLDFAILRGDRMICFQNLGTNILIENLFRNNSNLSYPIFLLHLIQIIGKNKP